MLRIVAQKGDEWVINPPIEVLNASDTEWFWVDYCSPTADEIQLLKDFFHFHPLAVEDCLNYLQRPKLEYYDNHHFFVVHALNEQTRDAHEVDLFLSDRLVVTYHAEELSELNAVWSYAAGSDGKSLNPYEIAYRVMDKLVDTYFPIMHHLEDRILSIDNEDRNLKQPTLINDIFDIRGDILKIRKSIVPMRELLYRILESKRLGLTEKNRAYFHDIYDHLMKLNEMLDAAREMTSDIRDNYISLNSHRMNSIMKTLTVVTTIFMPLTFIVGVYGMNFVNIPELKGQYNYYITMGTMACIALGMYLWFRKKGWFDKE